jgi:hypothetical protein
LLILSQIPKQAVVGIGMEQMYDDYCPIDVTPCSLVGCYLSFEGSCYLQIQGKKTLEATRRYIPEELLYSALRTPGMEEEIWYAETQ